MECCLVFLLSGRLMNSARSAGCRLFYQLLQLMGEESSFLVQNKWTPSFGKRIEWAHAGDRWNRFRGDQVTQNTRAAQSNVALSVAPPRGRCALGP